MTLAPHIASARILLACRDLPALLAFLTETVGLQLERIFPAEAPAVADLRAAGRLRFSSRALHRQIGHALSAHSRNLARVEAADKPEVLWDHPELERLHARLADEYELSERGTALERKLAWICDTIQTLLSLLQARRALGLEAAVVVLVGIEVAFTLYEHVIRPLWH